jgi:hypothetical protein
MRFALLLIVVSGCVFVPDTTEAKLARCRAEARSVYYTDGGTEANAIEAYEHCKIREGLGDV